MKTVTVTPEVRAVLLESIITADRVELPARQLERKLYEEVNKVLVAAGGKWNRSAKAHVFTRDPREPLGLVTTGDANGIAVDRVADTKWNLQQFFTPAAIAELVVETAGIRSGMRVLEPSAGAGALVVAAMKRGAVVTCVEIDPVNTAMLARLQPGPVEITETDFLQLQPDSFGRFDAVVMNPPFTKNQDIRHVRHALRFLEPGGTLTAIMSPGFTFGGIEVRRSFRELVDSNGWSVEELPANAFKESGTGVRTVLLHAS